MPGPANSTNSRFHAACLYIAFSCSTGVFSSSSRVIPAMSQKPPRGSAFSPYSIPSGPFGRRVDQTVGPKPMK